jgi:hypothetical protein
MSAQLDQERVDDYRHRIQVGERPAALALGLIDARLPAIPEAGLAWEQHLCLAEYVLDGHHKIAAAAIEGDTIPVLLFLSAGASIAPASDVERIVELLMNRPGA